MLLFDYKRIVNMKKVISIVFNNFKNDSRVLKECQSLKNNHFDVSVVALHEEGLAEHENYLGIDVHRMKLKTRGMPKSFFYQIIKLIETAFIIIKNYKKVDIIHCNDLLPLPIAVFMKFLSGGKMKIVYDSHEYQIETMKLKGKNFRKKVLYLTEKFLIKKTDSVITVSESIAQEYKRLYGLNEVSVVLNCPNYKEQQPTNKLREALHIDANKKILLYQGALAEGRGLHKLMEAAKNLNRDDFALVFMGMGPMTRDIELESKTSPFIYFQPAVPPDQILEYTSSANVGICLIEDSCLNYYYSLPNKLFEYAMAGLPILGSNLPEISHVLTECKSGIVIDDMSVEAFQKGLTRILDEDLTAYSNHAREMTKKYNWSIQEKQFLNIYNQLM
jgi:glycosyltransferase involved in cell wall biosynthesis